MAIGLPHCIMKLSYKTRLFLYFSVLFGLFTATIIVFERFQESRFKTVAMEEKLNAYADLILANTAHLSRPIASVDSVLAHFPDKIRITLIDKTGRVLYDNRINDPSKLPNHTDRPEIVRANKLMQGSDARISDSNGIEYFYYAKRVNDSFIRIALPYDKEIKEKLKSDNTFLYYILILFIITLLLMNMVANRFGKSIRQLHDFITASESGGNSDENFPNDELGAIGRRITQNYARLKEMNSEIATEREKLLQHIHSSEEGICFFTAEHEVEYYNGLFIRLLNAIVQEPTGRPADLFGDPSFEEVCAFLSNPSDSYFETTTSKHGKIFSLRLNIFENKDFEIIINDITRQEKTRRLKQEMTGNIAHELRTPITSIRGYLETMLDQKLDPDKTRHFIAQAYKRTLGLSELIHDMGMITKMEAAPASFEFEEVDIAQLLSALREESEQDLAQKHIEMRWNIPDGTVVRGNPNLLYAIFRNLTDNVARYAGEGIEIVVSMYNDDGEYLYFSFYDTGRGIEDERHLNRLFERFYRINEGRTRDTGGSGLGLSIVKNAIALHKGSVMARNREGGGLEYLFNLHK